MTDFSLNDPVEWLSSNTNKTGKIIAIVPAGKIPADIGIKAGGGGTYRLHESYVVSGRHRNAKRDTLYWPVVSLLRRVEA